MVRLHGRPVSRHQHEFPCIRFHARREAKHSASVVAYTSFENTSVRLASSVITVRTAYQENTSLVVRGPARSLQASTRKSLGRYIAPRRNYRIKGNPRVSIHVLALQCIIRDGVARYSNNFHVRYVTTAPAVQISWNYTRSHG